MNSIYINLTYRKKKTILILTIFLNKDLEHFLFYLKTIKTKIKITLNSFISHLNKFKPETIPTRPISYRINSHPSIFLETFTQHSFCTKSYFRTVLVFHKRHFSTNRPFYMTEFLHKAFCKYDPTTEK